MSALPPVNTAKVTTAVADDLVNSIVASAAEAASAPKPASWRDVIKVHPAAELFPRMGEAELAALATDIKKHGLQVPVTLWSPGDGQPNFLVDGRDRLDASELAGIKTIDLDRLVAPAKILRSRVSILSPMSSPRIFIAATFQLSRNAI
jgi:hypothetical protein